MNYLERRKRSSVGEVFWVLPGMSASDILAAYRFINVNTETDAKVDLTGNGYTLTNSGCSWNPATGMYVDGSHYLDNSSLRGLSVKSVVMKISNVWGGNYKVLTGNWGGLSVWVKTPFETASFAWHYQDGGIGHSDGLSIDYDQGGVHGTLARENVQLASGDLSDGVIGITNTGWGILYKDGSAVSLRNGTATTGADQGPWTRWGQEQVNIPRLVGGTGAVASAVTMNGYFYITYLAVYAKELSQQEHAAIAAKMV